VTAVLDRPLPVGADLVGPPDDVEVVSTRCGGGGLGAELAADVVDKLFCETVAAEGYKLTVDLAAQTVTTPSGESFAFDVDPERKHRLLNGLDDISLTLKFTDKIQAYEARRKGEAPWLFA